MKNIDIHIARARSEAGGINFELFTLLSVKQHGDLDGHIARARSEAGGINFVLFTLLALKADQ